MSVVIAILAFSLAPLIVGFLMDRVYVGLSFSIFLFVFLTLQTGKTVLLSVGLLILILMGLYLGQRMSNLIIGDYNAKR